MGAFSYHRFIFLLACIDRWKIYNRLVFACTVKTVIKVERQCVLTSKTLHCSRASSVLTVLLFACAASNRANLAFKTTIIEDTHLTLIGFLFKVEANNSLIFLSLQTYEKKFAEFPFLFISIIPWYNALRNVNGLDLFLSIWPFVCCFCCAFAPYLTGLSSMIQI